MATIVLHSRTREKISGTCYMEWSEHIINRNAMGDLITRSRLLSRTKALAIIKKYGLVEVHRTSDGEVYDTPGQALKYLFPTGLTNREDIRQIEKTDNL